MLNLAPMPHFEALLEDSGYRVADGVGVLWQVEVFAPVSRPATEYILF